MRMNHISEEINNAHSQINDENMSKIIFIESSVIVKQNIANAGPNAIAALPMNSAAVIFSIFKSFT
jgi:hypothetical protein